MNEKNQQAILEMIQERLSVSRLGSSMARQTDADLRVLQMVAMPAPSEHPFAGAQIRFD